MKLTFKTVDVYILLVDFKQEDILNVLENTIIYTHFYSKSRTLDIKSDEYKVGLGLEVGTCVNLKTLGYKINKSNEKGGWETDIRQLCKMSTTEKDELYIEPCPFLKGFRNFK